MKKLSAIFIINTFIIILNVFPSELVLTREEAAYLKTIKKISICVDPDWMPYEFVDDEGKYYGISADLLSLISTRISKPFELIRTKDWDESLKYSKAGKCMVLPFLNSTPEREQWLIFTEPIFTDPNVFITREEHPYITEASELTDETIVFPVGTAMEQIIRKRYPNLRIINVDTEMEAFRLVSEKKADLTMRSLLIAAYTIKKEGLFNLKIAGQMPEYTNQLRLGIVNNNETLRNILNKAVLTITSAERERIVNKHVYIKFSTPFDYGLLIRVSGLILLGGFLLVYYTLRLKKLNRQLTESKLKTERTLLEKDKLVEKLEQLNTEKDKFFAIIAHDLRSPFQSFLGITEVLIKDAGKYSREEIAEFSKDLNSKANNLYKLLKNLLEWARMQQGAVFFDPRYLDLNEIIKSNIERLKPNADMKNVVILYGKGGNFIIKADENMVNSILQNLISNAIKFSIPGGKVEIKTNKLADTGRIEIIVIDSGIGMDENLAESLFKVGKRINRKGTAGEESTGLGLLICKEFVEKHKGTIKVKSEEGRGSIFSFTLPEG